MSNNHRDRSGQRTENQQALLDELDSLKALLNKTEDEDSIAAAPWEFTPTPDTVVKKQATTAPLQNRQTETSRHPNANTLPNTGIKETKKTPEIPVLDEVVLPGSNRSDKIPELTDVVEVKTNSSPVQSGKSNQELQQLVEVLVEKQLRILKPIVTRQVIAELERLNSSAKKT